MPGKVASSGRTRDAVPALVIVAVWSFFAYFLFMMASSREFTPAARIGFNIGGAVCSLLGVFGLAMWILELAGIRGSDTEHDSDGMMNADIRGSEKHLDGQTEQFCDAGDVDLGMWHRDSDPADEGNSEEAQSDRNEEQELSPVMLRVMKLIEFLPAIVFLGLGIPLVVWFLWDTVFPPAVLLGLAACVAIYFVVRRIRRYRSRDCAECRLPMELLGEDDEDPHLSKTEILEEKLKSANYDVWMCPGCSRTQTIRYGAFLSRYSRCPACGARTKSVSTSVVSQPTNAMSGMKEITESCVNCDYKKLYRRSIPSTGS